MAKRNWYEVLGVNKTANTDEINRAYRKRVKRFHPDATKNDPKMTERFKEVQEAYETLSDENKRREYDKYEHVQTRVEASPPPEPSGVGETKEPPIEKEPLRPAVPVPPHPIFNRWVVVATVLVVVVIGGLLALAFLPHNPSWEQEHRDEILDLKQSAANLQITGDQAAALEKYHELVRLIAGQTIYDPELLDALADARRKCDDLLKSSTNIKPRSEATAHSTTMVFTPPMLEQPQSKLPTPSATTVVAAASILAVTPKAINEGVRGNSGTAAIDLGITTNDLGMKLVWIKPGSFLMGSPATEGGRFDDEIQHRVTLTSGFFMSTMLVTRGQFAKFAKDDGFMTDAETEGWATTWTGEKWADVNGASWRNPGFDQSDDHPVVQISWNDAEAFCRWLSRREDKHYRLPTEAEWEYACRAGTQTAYVWGDNPLDGKGWANCRDRTFSLKFPKANGPIFIWSDNYAFTSPVGVFKPNSWGLYDMIGNASEWCSDWYGPYPEGNALDPKGPSDDSASKFYIAVLHYNGPERILRGGSWFFTPRGCRCANRDRSPPGALRVSNAGFRVVLDSN